MSSYEWCSANGVKVDEQKEMTVCKTGDASYDAGFSKCFEKPNNTVPNPDYSPDYDLICSEDANMYGDCVHINSNCVDQIPGVEGKMGYYSYNSKHGEGLHMANCSYMHDLNLFKTDGTGKAFKLLLQTDENVDGQCVYRTIPWEESRGNQNHLRLRDEGAAMQFYGHETTGSTPVAAYNKLPGQECPKNVGDMNFHSGNDIFCFYNNDQYISDRQVCHQRLLDGDYSGCSEIRYGIHYSNTLDKLRELDRGTNNAT